MAEGYLRQSPLASLGLAARAAAEVGSAGVRMGERDRVGLANLRGDPADTLFLERARQALGTALPLAPNTVAEGGAHRVLWLGPNEWLVASADGVSAAPALAQAVAGLHATATDLSDARVAVTLAG
ncbi:MAG: sarcosine oxidase subunit gamma, partial [Alphaproteobacteria bacterium]|nr:sarcosine oxidase subunit gamma [Alphaproteobacteria bacterium]